MKRVRLLLLLASGLPFLVYGQVFEMPPYSSGDIQEEVIEDYEKLRRSTYMGIGRHWHDSIVNAPAFRSILKYGRDGALRSKKYSSQMGREILILSETYQRDTIGQVVQIRSKNSKNARLLPGIRTLQEIRLDASGRRISWNTIEAPRALDSLRGRLRHNNARYENGLLRSFDVLSTREGGDTMTFASVDLSYDVNGRVVGLVERSKGCFQISGRDSTGAEYRTLIRTSVPVVIVKDSVIYDEKGRVRELVSDDRVQLSNRTHGLVRKYRYDYDDRGNWIVIYVKVGDDPEQIERTRRLTYWKR